MRATNLVSMRMKKLTLGQLFLAATILRVGFFLFGIYQDAYMTVKYTDIDYLVFSDAAKYVVNGLSPYNRETYRYTPMLAWLMTPNHLWFYSWGKLVFVAFDLATGYLIYMLTKNTFLAAIWLLNPMVIAISTRGSAESVLTVLVMAFVYTLSSQELISAILLGLAIHFKLYPIIYLPTAICYITQSSNPIKWMNVKAIRYGLVTVGVVAILNWMMYKQYGYDFLYETYLYHFQRLDHRHNFSVYNVLLYYKSAIEGEEQVTSFSVESLAFIPQIAISGLLIPLLFWNRLQACLFLQTFAFVTFNKVMTSQYFIWFLIFLPGVIGDAKISRVKGFVMIGAWVLTQALWLNNAYNLEFLGVLNFDSGLVYSSVLFFLTNCWILSEIIGSL